MPSSRLLQKRGIPRSDACVMAKLRLKKNTTQTSHD